MSFTLKTISKIVTTVDITFYGFEVKRKRLVTNNEKIDIHDLRPDIYYVKILVNDHEIGATKRIIKK